MIQHVYERAAQASLIKRVLVATDDERIAETVHRFGGVALMTPSSLQSGTDRVAFAAHSVTDTDIIVNIQGDEPLMAPAMIDEGVRLVAEGPSPVGTLVRRIDREDELFNPNVVKAVLGTNGACLYFSRSPIPFGRDLPQREWLRHHTYYKHIGLYVFRRSFLVHFSTMAQTPLERAEKLEQLRILEHGFTIAAAITTYDSFPVDTPEDLQHVRRILATHHA